MKRMTKIENAARISVRHAKIIFQLGGQEENLPNPEGLMYSCMASNCLK